MVITNTDTSTNTCSGTLTVTWNGGNGKQAGITSLGWSADQSDTGALSFLFSGVLLAKAQKTVTETVPFTLTSGTGTADVSASGSGFKAQTTSNTVTCDATPDLTITNISLTATNGDPVPWSYTVTVKNIGTGTANVTNVVVQGYYTGSTDTSVFPPPGGASQVAGGDAACGTIMDPFATTLAPGASVDVIVGCGSGPTVSADTNLMVGVDVNNIVAESNENNNVAVVSLT
jgi:CARDB